VICPHCDKELNAASLGRHIYSQHNRLQRPVKRRRLLIDATRAPRHYTVFSPTYNMPLACPVPGCTGRGARRSNLRYHFHYRHPFDYITIDPEGHLPKCPDCGMQVPITQRHRNSAKCRQGKERKRK
jgi:hypothetical protein